MAWACAYLIEQPMPNQPSLRPAHSALKGIALVLCAVMVFVTMDSASKYLMTKFNVPLVAAARYGVNLLLLCLLMLPRHGTDLWKTKRTGLVVVRGLSLAAATLFAGLALQRMPVGETIAILYLQGFGVILAAGYFLKERVSLVGWLAATIGFIGVLLIARPGSSLDPVGVVFALLCAAVSVVYVLLTRALNKTESTMALLFHVGLAGSICFIVMAIYAWQWFDFTWFDLALMAYMGAAALAGHFLFTSAYRYAPASLLAPFNYFHIALAVVVGWLMFNHVPDNITLIGMAMIAIGGVAVAVHAHLSQAK
jgi:drug/metabolite transporter (DMT)-like permease